MKPTLNEQFIRMQKLAGIITENQINEIDVDKEALMLFIKQNKDEIIKKIKGINVVDINSITNDPKNNEVEAEIDYIKKGETMIDPKTKKPFTSLIGVTFRFADTPGGTFKGKSLNINGKELKYTIYNI